MSYSRRAKKYRQFFLRVTPDNVDVTDSSNLYVDAGRVITIVVELVRHLQ